MIEVAVIIIIKVHRKDSTCFVRRIKIGFETLGKFLSSVFVLTKKVVKFFIKRLIHALVIVKPYIKEWLAGKVVVIE